MTRLVGLFDLRPEYVRSFSGQWLGFLKAGKGKALSLELKFNDDDNSLTTHIIRT
jgi:hypothetical protein